MIAEIRKHLDKDNVIIGYKEVVKAIKNKSASAVFYATNIEESKKAELEKYCKITGLEIGSAGLPNDELGTICKKTFHISALAIKK